MSIHVRIFFRLNINKKAVTKQTSIRFCFTETQSRHKQHNAPCAKRKHPLLSQTTIFGSFFLISNLAEGASMKREAETFFFPAFLFRFANSFFVVFLFQPHLAEGAGTTREAQILFFIFFILLSRRRWHDARSEQFFFLMNEPLPRWVDTVKPELLALVVDQFC